MSGPLSAVLDGLARLTDRRAEAKVVGHLRRLAETTVFAGMAHTPEPVDFGDFNVARAILDGQLRIGGYITQLDDLTPWELDLPVPTLAHVLHRFDWLDDMAALGTKTARARAQGWVLGWLDRYAGGTGPGWGAEVVALRLFRLLSQHDFLRRDMAEDGLARIDNALALQTAYLGDVAPLEEDTRARMVALACLVHATTALKGFETRASEALDRLSAACADRVTDQGGIASRSPEDLLTVFRHLIWVRNLLTDLDRPVPLDITAVIARMAPTLRGLRHGDGTLVRFHGGGIGRDGVLDQALAESGERARPGDMPCMGFARLQGGRLGVVVDCARPPDRSDRAHASTLALEISSGRRPMIVSVGPTVAFKADWLRTPRTTSAHSAMALDKTSLATFGPQRTAGKAGLDTLQSRPGMVTLSRAHDATGSWIQARHDGYLADYGLLHERRVFVAARGSQVHGEDVLLSPDTKAQRRFQSRIKGAAKLGVALSVHFHLHPDVDAVIDRSAEVVHLTLKSGETWMFEQSGGLLDLEASAYVPTPLSEPQPTRQIVIRGRATTHAAEISWSLTREGDAKRAVRDIGVDAPDA